MGGLDSLQVAILLIIILTLKYILFFFCFGGGGGGGLLRRRMLFFPEYVRGSPLFFFSLGNQIDAVGGGNLETEASPDSRFRV